MNDNGDLQLTYVIIIQQIVYHFYKITPWIIYDVNHHDYMLAIKILQVNYFV